MPRTFWTDDQRRLVRELAGKVPARQIALRVGRTTVAVSAWARDNGVSLALPPSRTRCARYCAMRGRAFRLGLRLSANGGRISLWAPVAQHLTFDAAERFLHEVRRKRRDEIEAAWRAADSSAGQEGREPGYESLTHTSPPDRWASSSFRRRHPQVWPRSCVCADAAGAGES